MRRVSKKRMFAIKRASQARDVRLGQPRTFEDLHETK